MCDIAQPRAKLRPLLSDDRDAHLRRVLKPLSVSRLIPFRRYVEDMGGVTTEAPARVLESLGKLLREHRCTLIYSLFACGMSLHSAVLDFLELAEHISPSKIDRGDYTRGCYKAPPSIVNKALDALPHFIWIVAGSSSVERVNSRHV